MWAFYLLLIATGLNVGSGLLFGRYWGRTRVVKAQEGYTFYRGIFAQLALIAFAGCVVWAINQ
jgi:hypothetical protein